MRSGAWLSLLGGVSRQVDEVDCWRASPRPVFNITVAGAHTYFVGEQGVLVHNAK